MHAGGIQYRLLGLLVVGTICLLFAFKRAGTGCTDKSVGSPSAAGHHRVIATSGVDATPKDAPGVTVQSDCAPAPTSSVVVNVRKAAYGAKGDGVADDTAAIQRAVNAVAGTGGTVIIPDGTYLVNAVAQSSKGIRLGSNMTLSLTAGAILKAIPNASSSYAILAVSFATNVKIIGGTLLGDRSEHLGTVGEWGMGLHINNSNQVTVQGVTAKDCWGDGFYVTDQCSSITMCNLVADHNRRQGLSITSVNGMVVRNCTFKNTSGTEPEAGIDIEPNSGQTVANLLIACCTFTNNSGGGLQCGVPVASTGSAFVMGVVIDGNTFSNNGVNPAKVPVQKAVEISNCDGTKLTNNIISNNTGEGILLRNHATHTLISGNTVTGTISVPGHPYWSGGGIYLTGCANSTVTGNIVKGNSGAGITQSIHTIIDTSVTITGNTVTGNGIRP